MSDEELKEKIGEIIDKTYNGDFMYHDIIPRLVELFKEYKCK